MNRSWLKNGGTLAVLLVPSLTGFAWDYAGHRLVNELALQSLPAGFPAFVRTPVARERIAFLAGEPDRWRNTTELPLKHCNGPDHFFDIEDLADYQMKPEALTPFRYEFVAQLARGRAAHPEKFPALDPVKDTDHTKAFFGFLPWTINEYYAKLKSGFSYLKALEAGGTPEEVENARQNIIYIMGVMGHFVGDSTQPLHTTRHYNGWLEENKMGYSTKRTLHAWIDGGFLRKVGLESAALAPKIHPAQAVNGGARPDGIFPEVVKFIVEQHKKVEPLYQLDRDGKLSGTGADAMEGKKFLNDQLVLAGQMLGDIWLTAWQSAPADNYLKAELAKRKLASEAAPAKP